MTEVGAPIQGFASLAELQEQHSALVKVVGKDILSPANLERIAQFVRKSIATGAVLDAPADRAAAQSLISFWTSRLASASRDRGTERSPARIPEFEDTLLAEFNSDALVAAVIAPTDRWLDLQSPTDQKLARHLVLRLITLREDGTFGVVLGTSEVYENLEFRDRAEVILARLVKLGVVRRTRNPSGYEEFSLQSAELLDLWPRLQEWMALRKQFREKAMLWAQRRAAKAANPSRRSFMQRVEKAFGMAVQTLGGWIETHWKALLESLKIRDASEEFLSEEEYEEAEAYRDRNAVELRLVYEKRQHDKQRQERRQARSVAFVAAAVLGLAALAVWGIRGYKVQREATRRAQDNAQRAQDDARRTDMEKRQADTIAAKQKELNRAAQYYEMGAQSEADDWDTSGAFLWYVHGWPDFDRSADVLDSKESERLRTRYLFQLATARKRLPVLSGMAYHKGMVPPAHSADGRFLLTVGAAEGGEKAPPIVRFWRWSGEGGRAEWKSSILPWDGTASGRSFAQPVAHVSPNGRFAIVRGTLQDNTSAVVYMWEIPEVGEVRPAVELRAYAGDEAAAESGPDGQFGEVTAAGFSPDSQLFAIVSQQEDRRKLYLWRSRSGRWQDPQELKSPDGVGQFGQFAFCTTPSGNRLAVVVESAKSTSGDEGSICLEWSFDKPSVGAPRRYTLPGQFPVVLQQGNKLNPTLVTYKTDGSVLLVSNSVQNRPWSDVLLFNSKKDSTGEWRYQYLFPAGPVVHAAFSQVDDRLVTASADGNVVLWSVSSTGQGERRYEQVNTFKHKGRIFKADFSPDGHHIVIAGRDTRALVWDVNSGRLAQPSFHHVGSVTDAGFADGGRCLVTSSRDAIYRWDLTRGEGRSLPLGTMGGVQTAAADPEGDLVVTAGQRLTRPENLESAAWARAWDAATGDPRSPELRHPAPVVHAAVSGSGRGLVSTVTGEGELRLWDASSGRLLLREKPEEGMAVYTAFGRAEGQVYLLALIRGDPQSLFIGSYLRVYPLNSRGEPAEGPRRTSYAALFTAAVFSPDCKYVVAYTGDGADGRGEAVVWELRSGKQKALAGRGRMGTAHDGAVTHAAFTRDGDYLVTTGRDDKAYVWALRDGSRRGELPTKQDEANSHSADIEFASFDRAGTRLATAGGDGLAIVWEGKPGQGPYRLAQKLKHDRPLTHVVFGTDDRYVLTADSEGTTYLWDVKGSRPLVTKYHPGQTILQIVGPRDGNAPVYLIGYEVRRVPYDSNRLEVPALWGNNPSGGLAWPVVTEWRLTRDNPPGDDDRRLARLTSSRQVLDGDDRLELASTAQDLMFDFWREARARTNRTILSTGDEVGRWHEREAALCERDERWSAAIEHWKRALENTSADAAAR